MEVSRFDPESPNHDPEAKKGPIQTQVDRMLEYIEKLDTEYKPDAQTKSSTPSTAATSTATPSTEELIKVEAPDGTKGEIPASQKDAALKRGYKIDN